MATEIARLDAVLGADVSGFVKGMNKAEQEVLQFNKLAGTAAQLSPFSKATASAIGAAKSVGQLKDILHQLKIEQAAATNPKELTAYNNAIKNVTAEVKRLSSTQSSVGGVSKALSSTFSSAKNLAYLIPGLGIAGIFDLAFTAISKAAGELGLFGKKTKEASEETKAFEKAMDSMQEKIAQELFSLQKLNQIATDTSNPYNIRLNAVKKLKDEYPQYLKGLSDEALLTGAAANAIKDINQALLAKLTLQAGEEKIVKLLKQRLDLQLKLNDTQEKNLTTLQFAESLKDATGNMKALGVQMKKDVQVAIPLNKKYENSIRDIDNQVKALFQTLRGAINLSAPLDLIDPKPLKEKGEKAAKDWYEGWKKQMIKLSTGGIVLGSFQQEVQKLVGKQGKLTITPTVEVKGFELSDTAKQAVALAETIRSILEQAVEGIGESIGNLLTGKKNPFSNLFDIIGQGLKALGKELIVIGKLGVLIQAALKSIFANPTLAIAAGIAAIALGTAISNLGGGIKQNAEGGIFTQPTLLGRNLVAEKEPEALIPLSRLANMNGSGNNIQISGRLVAEGNQLVAVINAANRQNSRTYGSNFNRANGA